jgi:hypothetical protein
MDSTEAREPNPMGWMQNGQRVEVKLNRGEADVWYAGTVMDARTLQVKLDPATEHLGEDDVVDERSIVDCRPMTRSPDDSEV